MRKSKIAPEFKVTQKSEFGLRQMMDEPMEPPMRKATVVMYTESIKPLTGISPMEPARCCSKAWKPKGRG